MEHIKVTVSWSGDNYAAGTEQVNGVVLVTHKNLEMLKKEFAEAFAFHLDSAIEDGEPLSKDLQQRNYQLDYELLTSALLHSLDGVVTLSAIHKATGINEKQLGHYKTGLKNPRPVQRKKIIDGIHTIGKELLNVE